RSAPRARRSCPCPPLPRRTRCPARRPPRPAPRSGGFPPRGRSRALHPAHRPEVAPRGAAVALRVVAHVTRTNAGRVLARSLPRRLDLAPERLLVEVVVLREPGEVVASGLAKHPAREPATRERTVDAAERLDPDEVSEREHVEGNLEPELAIDV